MLMEIFLLLDALLVVLSVLCFIKSGQTFLNKISRGLIKKPAMPWIGLIAIFLWSFVIVRVPILRGIIFGLFLIAIAATLSFWAVQNEKVKSFVQDKFFNGYDIWEDPDFKWYIGMLYGAGVVLVVPFGGVDALFNVVGFIGACAWLIKKSYQGHKNKAEDDSVDAEKERDVSRAKKSGNAMNASTDTTTI